MRGDFGEARDLRAVRAAPARQTCFSLGAILGNDIADDGTLLHVGLWWFGPQLGETCFHGRAIVSNATGARSLLSSWVTALVGRCTLSRLAPTENVLHLCRVFRYSGRMVGAPISSVLAERRRKLGEPTCAKQGRDLESCVVARPAPATSGTARLVCRIIVACCAGVAVAGSSVASAGESVSSEKTSKKHTARSGWGAALGAPLYRLRLERDTGKWFHEPPTHPGLGVGYSWGRGTWGIFFFPGASLGSGDAIDIAPELITHLLLFDIGIGYEWQLREDQNGDLRPKSDGPFFAFAGVSLNSLQILALIGE